MNAIKEQFVKNIQTLRKEVESYADDADLWRLRPGISNTPANLALHLCGNLKHNIGAVLGNNGFVRKRDEEFSTKGASRKEILSEIDLTINMIEPVVDKLASEDLTKPWPNDFYGEDETIGSVLIRVAVHLGYHLGQINYHRRMMNSYF